MSKEIVVDLNKAAFDLLSLGDKEKALLLFLQQVEKNPNDFDALHMSGVLLAEHGNPERGVGLLKQAIQIAQNKYLYNNYGNVLLTIARLNDAEEAFRNAIALDDNYAEAWSNLGNLYLQRCDYVQALAYYSKAIEIRPDFADANANRAVVNHALGQYQKAVIDLETALSFNPGAASYYLAYAELKMDMHELHIAKLLINKSLELAPNSGLALATLGRLEGAKRNYKKAVEILVKAIDLCPYNLAAYRHCALAYSHLGNKKEAANLMEKACQINPNDPNLYWELCFMEIPPIVHSESEARDVRDRLMLRLDDISKRKDQDKIKVETIANVGPFYLMYHGINDLEIYKKYGSISSNIIGRRFEVRNIIESKANKKIRICLVSGSLFKHSVWASNIEGFYKRINKNHFDIFTIDLVGKIGVEVKSAKNHSAYYKNMADCGMQDVIDEICQINPDILYYPEIGLDATVIRLANLRICKNQVTTWGNPETLGLPYIDYFISVKEFERKNARDFYSENLRLIPLAESYYASRLLEDKPDEVIKLGVDLSKKIVLCLGSSFKIQYNFFKIFQEIWENNEDLQFVFSDNGNAIAEAVKSEIYKICGNSNSGNTVLFIPWQREEVFYSLMRRSFIMLEGMNFSGYNMAMQALECGLPIVCRRGEMLRENFAAGLLEVIGAGSFVAPTLKAVPQLLKRLLNDVDYYLSFKNIVASDEVKTKLFDRDGPMPELENFFRSIV